MKKLVIAALFCCIGMTALNAQTPTHHREIGVKINSIFNPLFDLPSSPYQLTYKQLGKKKNRRYGFGLHLSSDLLDDNPRVATSMRFRIGKEKTKALGKRDRLLLNYGWDWKLNTNLQAGGDYNSTIISGGGGPLLGLQYKLTNRLLIGTEMSYDLMLSHQQVNHEHHSLRLNTNYNSPGTVWLSFRF